MDFQSVGPPVPASNPAELEEATDASLEALAVTVEGDEPN